MKNDLKVVYNPFNEIVSDFKLILCGLNNKKNGYDLSFYDKISVSFPEFDWIKNQDQFEKMMGDLTSHEKKNLSKIHTLLTHTLGYGGGGKEKKIQINGTCSFHCITEAIKDYMGTKVNYLNFKLDFLREIQEEFQIITDAMKPLVNKDESIKKLYPVHLQLLKENAKEIQRTKKLLELNR